MSTPPSEPRPLSHLTVAEAGDGVAVRYCTRLFAQLGARVLSAVTERNDERLGFAGEAGRAYGRWLDAGKTPTPPDAVLAGGCDLVVCGQAAEGLAAGAALADAHSDAPPRLELTWFDPDGPYAAWTGSDEVIAGLNGVAYPFGEAEGPPMLAQGHPFQIVAGLTAFNAALGALLALEEAQPRRVQVNVFEASLCLSETAALATHAGDAVTTRLGVNRYVPTYPSCGYRTADGWVGVTCLTIEQWSAMCGLIGRPELTADPRFAETLARLAAADAVDALLTTAIPARTTAEWVELGMRHRIPVTPMVRPGLTPTLPHWRERGAFAPFDGSGVLGPTLPWRMHPVGSLQSRWRPPQGATLPLAGLRVVDFSMGWAGPLCTRTLGDLGADVVKVESVRRPDWWRGFERSIQDDTRETRPGFMAVNRNKRGVDLDLTQAEGVRHAKALIAGTDVVVENYAAGVMQKLGLGMAVQGGLRPGLVSVSMPAFGNGGPLSPIRAYGSTVEQASGMPFVNGEPHWPPAQQHLAFGDPIAGLYAAAAVLAALAGRPRLGGAEIDLAQVACLFQVGADAIIAEQVSGAPAPRTGSRRARLPLCTVVAVEAEDRWLVVAPQDEAALARLAAIVGGADEAAVAAWAQGRPAGEAAAALQAHAIAAAPVQRVEALIEDPQLRASGFWCELERAFVGRHLNGAAPFLFDGRRLTMDRCAPVLGEHTEEVLGPLAS